MKLSRNARKLVALMLSAALVLGGITVNGSSASAAKKATLKLNKKSAKLTVGKKLTLKVTKKNVKSAKITWKSSKKAVASVSKKGVVKAKKAGKTKISATIKYKAKGSKKTQKKTLKCTVTVTKKNAVVASKAPASSNGPAGTSTPAPGGDVTTAPTNAPGGDTTTAPTNTPGGDATAVPTNTPGGDATAAPTNAPGGNATAAPTNAPGGNATAAPTNAPSETEAPFALPSFRSDVTAPTSIELKKGETKEIPAALDMGSLTDYTPVFDGWAYNSTTVSALDGIKCDYDATKGAFTIKVNVTSQASIGDTPKVYLGLTFEKDGAKYQVGGEDFKLKLADCEISKIEEDTSAPTISVTKTDIPAYISLKANTATEITAAVTITAGTTDITGYSPVWEYGIHYPSEEDEVSPDLGNADYAFDATSGKWTVTPKADFTLDYSKSPSLDLSFKLKKGDSYFQIDGENYLYTCASIPIVKSGTKLEFESDWAASDDHGNNYLTAGTHTVAVDAAKLYSLSVGDELCVYLSAGATIAIGGDLSKGVIKNDWSGMETLGEENIYAGWSNAGISYYTLTEAQVNAIKKNGLFVTYQKADGDIDIMIVDK